MKIRPANRPQGEHRPGQRLPGRTIAPQQPGAQPEGQNRGEHVDHCGLIASRERPAVHLSTQYPGGPPSEQRVAITPAKTMTPPSVAGSNTFFG
jgi:hypothetical protein